MTRAGRAVALGGLVAVAIGVVVGIVELVAAGAACLILVVICLAWVSVRHPVLDVQRRVLPSPVHVGMPCRVELTVTNRARRTSPVLVFNDPVTSTVGATASFGSLAPGASATFTYHLPTSRRGRFDIGPLRAGVTDPFGLASRERIAGGPMHATVLPHIDRIAPVRMGGGMNERVGAPRRHAAGPGEEFTSLRPYVRGDDLRRVHWRSSARATDLLVRQEEPPSAGQTTALIDNRASCAGPAALEHLVSAAASVVTACARRGDEVRVVTADGRDSGFGRGRRHIDQILDGLAVLGPATDDEVRPALNAFRRRPSPTTVAIVASTPPDDLAAIAEVCRAPVLVRFETSAWPLGVGAGLTDKWPDARSTTSGSAVNVAALSRGFRAVATVSAAHPFAAAWKTAR